MRGRLGGREGGLEKEDDWSLGGSRGEEEGEGGRKGMMEHARVHP